jgi:hypothetical protein
LADLLASVFFLAFLFCSNDNLIPASNNADISGVRLTPPLDLFDFGAGVGFDFDLEFDLELLETEESVLLSFEFLDIYSIIIRIK